MGGGGGGGVRGVRTNPLKIFDVGTFGKLKR